MQVLKYRSVTDIVRPIREIDRRSEETTVKLRFIVTECIGVRPNCRFVRRKPKCTLVQD
jgi:hypothetical protein